MAQRAVVQDPVALLLELQERVKQLERRLEELEVQAANHYHEYYDEGYTERGDFFQTNGKTSKPFFDGV